MGLQNEGTSPLNVKINLVSFSFLFKEQGNFGKNNLFPSLPILQVAIFI